MFINGTMIAYGVQMVTKVSVNFPIPNMTMVFKVKV